jgi:hypothetical protein
MNSHNLEYAILEEKIEKYIVEEFVPKFMKCNFIKRKYKYGEQMNSIIFLFDDNKLKLSFNYNEWNSKVIISAFLTNTLSRKKIFNLQQNEELEKIFPKINLNMKKERLKNLYKGD